MWRIARQIQLWKRRYIYFLVKCGVKRNKTVNWALVYTVVLDTVWHDPVTQNGKLLRLGSHGFFWMIWTTVAFSLLVTLLNTLTSSLKLGRVSRQKLTVDTKMKKTDSDALMGVTYCMQRCIYVSWEYYCNICRFEGHKILNIFSR